MIKNKKAATRRYYMNQKLKKKYPVNGHTRTIDIKPYRSFEEIPVGDRYYVGQLIKMGYNIQLELFELK